MTHPTPTHPPHPRSVPPPLLKSPPPLLVHVDGSCILTHYGPSCGYSAHIAQHPTYITLAEPLPGSQQTANTAEVHALLAALELVSALRPVRAAVLTDSEYVAKSYNAWMDNWHSWGWRKSGGGDVPNVDAWKKVFYLRPRLVERGVVLYVRWVPRNSTPGMEVADHEARQAAKRNVWCKGCGMYVGRAMELHRCLGPLMRCRKEGCGFRGAQAEVGIHERVFHGGLLVKCEFCEGWFEGQIELKRHMKECWRAPFCKECEIWFASVGKREQHYSAVHGYGYEPGGR